MRILRHFTANDEQLEPFNFRRELSMEAYLVENEGILKLDETFADVEIVAEELTLKQGRSSNDTDGRIDLLVTYSHEYIGIIELKLGRLDQLHLDQLEDYLKTKLRILDEFPDILPDAGLASAKWIGVLAGSAISPALAEKLSDGFSIDGVPIAALVIQRFRSQRGNIYVTTDTYFKNSSLLKDTSKFQFNNTSFGKGRLVLAVIKQFVESNPETTYAEMERQFPKKCQGTSVFLTVDEANHIFTETGHRRHFLKSEELIELSDATIAISNQWGIGNIYKFIDNAKDLGFDISEKA